MSLTQASDAEDMQVKINVTDKQSKNGDEQIQGMSVSDVPEFTDPAILIVREAVKIRYTREELMKLRDAPLSKQKPDFIDISEVSPSILDPERWNFERKKSDTPTENGPRTGDSSEHRRRPGDPRDRIRKEYDGIVLSPQRRSFNSGCFVPVREAARTNRPHSPLGGKNESPHIDKNLGVREIQTGTRRIGSGRILRDSWDFNDKSESGDNDFGFRGQQRNNDRDEKYERRSFGRDFDLNRDRENTGKEGRRNGRYDRRRISENQEEPEWFSSGPISQADTIELRGFDESEKPTAKKKVSPSRVRRAKEWSKKKSDTQNPADEKGEARAASDPAKQTEESTEQKLKPPEATASEVNTTSQMHTNNSPENKVGAITSDQQFNFDDILKCDTIPGLLTNGVGADGDNTKSRFSRWFKQDSPEKLESRRSSLQDDHNIIKDLLNDIGETNVTIPGDSDAYFAPISPAANNSGIIGINKRSGQPQSQPINIVEMLQRSKHQSEVLNTKPSHMSGKILSLDELEAKMRQNIDLNAGVPQKHQKQKPDEEMTAAFKKLLAQAQAGGHPIAANGPINKTQPMSLLEMLNHSQQQDEAARLSANPHLLSSGNRNINSLHHHASDLTLKLQQAQLQQQQQAHQKQQMDMLNKLINATVHTQQLRTSPLHDLGMQQSRDLLSRPEAQAILQAMHQRIPSPRELQVHTQNILQRALIKKKLEEQQENYRKKQEMQRGQSPNTGAAQGSAKSVSSPTPLAFTPTSVLRKMTADKDEGKENKATVEGKTPAGRAVTGMRPPPPQPQGQQWNTQFPTIKQPAGRPIVKANTSNYQSQSGAEFYNQQQQQQQQHIFNQPPPVANPLCQQPKKPSVAQFGGNQTLNGPGGPQTQYNPQYPTNQQFVQQLTQQQLRAQHQHRPVNQQLQPQHQQAQQSLGFQQHQGNQQIGATWQQFFSSAQQTNRNSNPIGRSGLNDGDLSPTTSNQLARWFSPDLLERARGGELPSTAGLAQHALSLEEIERQTAPPVHN